MPRPRSPFLLMMAAALLLLPGCLAKAALDVVTLPVRAAGAGVDAVTTSQAEADQKRGRAIRRREQRLGTLERQYDDLAQDCGRGDDRACRQAVTTRAEIDRLLSGVPRER